MKRKVLPQSEAPGITCHGPFTETVVEERNVEYQKLSNVDFQKRYRQYLYTPATVEFPDGSQKQIQMNFCADPFCAWYGLEQKEYAEIKYKPSRYQMNLTDDNDSTVVICKTIPSVNTMTPVLGNTTASVSNWSVAEEIKRLIVLNSVAPLTPTYMFHKDGCAQEGTTPFEDNEGFLKRGKSKSNAGRFQCRQCGKITDIMPTTAQRFNYNQRRNDVVPQLCKLLFSRTPVKRICELLDIGSNTFYNKIEWIYQKCLEFNQRHEVGPLKDRSCNRLWINSDMMIYNLNNTKKKGHSKGSTLANKDKKMQTYIICSADIDSSYAFRCDVAYDSNVTLEQIEADTKLFHCDHSYRFLRKNDRLQYSVCPQPPTASDTQSEWDYLKGLSEFNDRKRYIDGCHVRPQYTVMAHFLLLSWTLKSYKWSFVTDDDAILENCIFKVFSEKFRSENAVYFTCQYEKEKTLEEAGAEALRSRLELRNWAIQHSIDPNSRWRAAKAKLKDELEHHVFYAEKKVGETLCTVRGNNPIRHPLPAKDEGTRWVNLISPLHNASPAELADLIIHVNSRSVNNFFQEVRRRISILERPLTTARGDGKSYIYANYNPKYAQQLLAIFRTFYNFCWPRKYSNGSMTPAQRLGITERVYDYKDIIYFR